MSTTKDVAFHINDTWGLDAECRDADLNLIDIDQAEWRLASDTTRFVLATIGNGITVTGEGTCAIRVNASMQGNITPGIYHHELWVVGSDQIESIQITGSANIVDTLKRKFP